MALIDRAGTIYTQMEEQSSKPIFDLTHKAEQKAKLQAEVSILCCRTELADLILFYNRNSSLGIPLLH